MAQIDEIQSLRSLDGNRELLLQLAQIFVEDSPILIRSLQWALDCNDAPAARLAAHSLKGLVSTFYAGTTLKLAQQVENFCAIDDLESARGIALSKLVVGVQELVDEMEGRGWFDQN